MRGFRDYFLARAVLLAPIVMLACGDDSGSGQPGDTGDVDGGPDGGQDVDGGPDGGDTGPDPIICRACTTAAQCGDEGNLCINLPSGETVCGVDCRASDEICPEGTICQGVGEGGALRQCVPEDLFCFNQCGDPPRECDEGEFCDPLTGQCGGPRDLCQQCSVNAQCGEGNVCIGFPDGLQACGRDCTADAGGCPDGYLCGILNEEGTIRQCVPENLTCVDRCQGVECAGGQQCDPITGECAVPLGLCDPCLTSPQCGVNNLCLTLQDSNAYCAQDCGIASPTPGVCPAGFLCQPLNQNVSQCIPTLLTCVDHCQVPEPVACPEGFNCDPTDTNPATACHASQVQLCQRPCNNNYECGGQNDLCISIEGGLDAPICSADCDADNPCPIGYSCFPLTDGSRMQCAPSNFEDGCQPCLEISCPEGEACRPSDGACLPLPSPCISNADCPVDELCNIFEGRCEPVGLPCRHNEFFDCNSNSSCSATSEGLDGVCLQECSATIDGCPDWAPECENYYRIFVGVCVERGLGGPESCGRYADTIQQVGRPCPFDVDNDNCGPSADVCLTDVLPNMPGFCTATCNAADEEPCPAGGTCSRVPGELQSYCVPDECGCMAVPDLELGTEDVLQSALDALDLNRCHIAYNQSERDAGGLNVANDPYRVRLAGEVRNEALRGVDVLAEQRSALGEPVGLSAAILLGASNLNYRLTPAARDFTGATFCEVVQALYAVEDTPPTCEDLADEELAIPAGLLADVSTALNALGVVATTRDSIFSTVDPDDLDDLLSDWQRLVLPDGGPAPDVDASRDVVLRLNFAALYEQAAVLAVALEELPLVPDREAGPVDAALDLLTPRGRIVIQGDGDHTYCNNADECSEAANPVVIDGPLLLLIDTGGDDEYLIPGANVSGGQAAVSVVLDLGGDDLYSYAPGDGDDGDLLTSDEEGRAAEPLRPVSLSTVGRQGSARAGFALQLDRGQGSDRYESLRTSQGFGMLGVGALVDDGCQDVDVPCEDAFVAESLSQGAGLLGIGVLLTGDNAAVFTGYHLVQGAGGPLGAGLLVNTSGDDEYIAVTATGEDILVVPPVLANGGNFSGAQGAGVGVPSAVPTAGGNVSGGIGVLVDLDGTDSYSAGVLGQGAGYWHGLGMLLDGGGDDLYEVSGYGQGVGQDYGVGLLAEQAGADDFNADADPEPRVLGSGDNFGVGLAIDESGSDTYRAAAQSLGVGFFNGTGIFIENDGNDSYVLTSQETLGKATLSIIGAEPPDNPRRLARTVGVFVDANGFDSYTGRQLATPLIGNDLSWFQRTVGLGDDLIEWGVGADSAGGTGLTTLE